MKDNNNSIDQCVQVEVLPIKPLPFLSNSPHVEQSITSSSTVCVMNEESRKIALPTEDSNHKKILCELKHSLSHHDFLITDQVHLPRPLIFVLRFIIFQ